MMLDQLESQTINKRGKILQHIHTELWQLLLWINGYVKVTYLVSESTTTSVYSGDTMTTLKDSARHIDNPVCPVLSKICGVGFSLVFIGPSIAMLVVGVKLRGNCPADKNIPVFMIGIIA